MNTIEEFFKNRISFKRTKDFYKSSLFRVDVEFYSEKFKH